MDKKLRRAFENTEYLNVAAVSQRLGDPYGGQVRLGDDATNNWLGPYPGGGGPPGGNDCRGITVYPCEQEK